MEYFTDIQVDASVWSWGLPGELCIDANCPYLCTFLSPMCPYHLCVLGYFVALYMCSKQKRKGTWERHREALLNREGKRDEWCPARLRETNSSAWLAPILSCPHSGSAVSFQMAFIDQLFLLVAGSTESRMGDVEEEVYACALWITNRTTLHLSSDETPYCFFSPSSNRDYLGENKDQITKPLDVGHVAAHLWAPGRCKVGQCWGPILIYTVSRWRLLIDTWQEEE